MTLFSQDADGKRGFFNYGVSEWVAHAICAFVLFVIVYAMDVAQRLRQGEAGKYAIVFRTVMECAFTSILVSDLIVDVVFRYGGQASIMLVGAAIPLVIFITFGLYSKICGKPTDEEVHAKKRAGNIDDDNKKKKSYEADTQQKKSISPGRILRGFLNKFVSHPDIWPSFEGYSSFLTIVAILFYVYGTYITGAFRSADQRVDSGNCPWTYTGSIADMNKIDMYLSPMLITDYVLRFMVEKKYKMGAFLDFFMLCDFLSISSLPVWLFGMPPSQVQSFGFLKFLRLLRVINLKFVSSRMTKVRHQVLHVIMVIFSLFFCCAGLMLTLEYGEANGDFLCWHDALYFSVASLTTVGYGDIGPISMQGRILCSAILIVGVGLVSFQINQMAAVIQQTNRYGGSYHGNDAAPHVILTGNFDSSSVKAFLNEFYHPNHALKKTDAKVRVLLMHPEKPSDGVKILLEDDDEGFDLIEFIQGSPSNMRDLRRACVRQAKAIFLMAKKSSIQPLEEDTSTILSTLAIRKSNRFVKIYAQCLVPESVTHLKSAGANFVDCIPNMRSAILSNSFACPGATAFIANLCRSCDYDGSIYADGCDWELYLVPFSECFYGLDFHRAVMVIYENVQPRALLIGVKTRRGKTVINPGKNYQIKQGDHAIVMAVDMPNAQSTQTEVCVEPAKHAKTLQNIENAKMAQQNKSNETTLEDLIHQGNQEEALDIIKGDGVRNHHSDDIPDDIQGHVIICGSSNGLKNIIEQTRDAHSNVMFSKKVNRVIPKHFHEPPVVIITDRPNKEVSRARELENVYTIFASATEFETLVRAHAAKASMVTVLADRKVGQSQDAADGQSIKIALNLRAACHKKNVPEPFSVCELLDSKNTVYADPTGWGADDGDYFPLAPIFAEGKIYTVDTQDTLLCQAYYNPTIYQTVEQMVKGTTALRQIRVPPELVGKTYEEAFKKYSSDGEHIVVGLYCFEEEDDFVDLDGDGILDAPEVKSDKSCFSKLCRQGVGSGQTQIKRSSAVSMFTNRRLPCVCTNPSTSHILAEHDTLIMLGHTDHLQRKPKVLLRAKSFERASESIETDHERPEQLDEGKNGETDVFSRYKVKPKKFTYASDRLKLGLF
jgi:Trk K+ transport system NAD-binding subunit